MPEITFERLKMLVADLAMTEALLKDEVAELRSKNDALVEHIRKINLANNVAAMADKTAE